MAEFRFYHPIEVRYGDLDPQGHVNNAKYLTYLEQSRVRYIQRLGLWASGSPLDIGFIVADVHLTFHAPIFFGQPVQVGARVSRIGNKSMTMVYRIEDARDSRALAASSAVLVAYNYHLSQTIPLPDTWRKAIGEFEGFAEPEDSEAPDVS